MDKNSSMAQRTTVVISQSPSSNPAKRQLEEDIVTGLLFESGIDVTVVPNLYDLKADSTGMLALSGVSGNMVVCAWLFERATRWILDRNDVRGNEGTSLLTSDDEDDEFEDEANDKERVLDSRPLPNRKIYCLDLRATNSAQEYIDEVKRIHKELSVKVVQLGDLISGSDNGLPDVNAKRRFENPTNDTALSEDGKGLNGSAKGSSNGSQNSNGSASGDSNSNGSQESNAANVTRIEAEGGRRWYPVIDFGRCTNCMECIDFCLFGVYGVDNADTILVEQPDNCRKGCPACSRVCPENAIIFPQHKTPAIAGSAEVGGSMKIDLSQLFGAPDAGKSAEELAALERDEQLLAAGRDAVGMSVGMPKRQADQPAGPKDDLDKLMDQLDDLDV